MSRQSPVQASSPTVLKRSNRKIALLLIAAGAFLLVYTSGLLSSVLWSALLPIALIAAGVDLVTEGFQRRRVVTGALIAALVLTPLFSAAHLVGRDEPRPVVRSPRYTQVGNVGDINRVRAEVTLTAGELAIEALSDESSVVAAIDSARGHNHRYRRDDGTGVLVIDQGPLGADDLLLSLTENVPINLKVEMGTGAAAPLDFENLQLETLELNLGSGSTEVTLPDEGEMDITINVRFAGDVEIEVPDDLAAWIEAKANVGEVEVDERFQLSEGAYISEDYNESAADRATIRVTTTAGSIRIR